jgi:hypothetical protein
MYRPKAQRSNLINSLLAMLCLLNASALVAIDNNQVTVYRCTDAKGKVTMQDFACNPGSAQNVSKMARPKDSPTAKPALTAKSPPAIVMPSKSTQDFRPYRPPPDLYQCTDFDGKVREAEFYDPKPRCVPLWVQGYQTSSNACSWVEDSCLRYEGEELCERWIAKQKQAVLNADRPSAENTDFKKAEAARLTQIVKDSCW